MNLWGNILRLRKRIARLELKLRFMNEKLTALEDLQREWENR